MLTSVPSFTAFTADVDRGDLAIVADFTDIDLGQGHGATVNWGDGSPVETVIVDHRGAGGTIYAMHDYAQTGTDHAVLTLIDSTWNAVSRNIDPQITELATHDYDWTPPEDPGVPSMAQPARASQGQGQGDISPPAVAEVLVNSTLWTTAFRIIFTPQASAPAGFPLPAERSRSTNFPGSTLIRSRSASRKTCSCSRMISCCTE